jgi:peptide/nickel transport system substrate-binding protein
LKRWCFLLIALAGFLSASAQTGGELRFCLRAEPKTFNPLLVDDDASETIRYLTGGVLVRVNRITQKPQPELATEWKVEGGKRIVFKLRSGVRYSDGTAFSAEDVAFTMRQLMAPGIHSSTADAFRSGEGTVTARVISPTQVEIVFPAPVANLVNLFDTVAIISSHSPQKEMAALGPFYVADHKAGSYILLDRNPNYWKKDSAGRQLPYVDRVRLDIEQSRDIEALRYRRGEIHLINTVSPEIFQKLAEEDSASVRDAGTSTDSEQLWFNQVPAAPIPAYKIRWFSNTAFRRAVSEAINREDLARIVYHGHARAAIGMFPPSNLFWFNAELKPHPYDPAGALRRLQQDGFRLDNGTLRDREGHVVEFSVITNAGNRAREAMAAMIQEDLKKIGIQLNVVTLDFNSLLERITQTYNYEACLLGNVNGDLDPSSIRTAWESWGEEHQWNPKQKSPATPWEAEIDSLLRAESSSVDARARKHNWDRIQKIAWEQEPFIYLVNKDTLVAISPVVKNAQPSVLRPQAYWNIEELSLATK